MISILVVKCLQRPARLSGLISTLVAMLRWNLLTYRDLWNGSIIRARILQNRRGAAVSARVLRCTRKTGKDPCSVLPRSYINAGSSVPPIRPFSSDEKGDVVVAQQLRSTSTRFESFAVHEKRARTIKAPFARPAITPACSYPRFDPFRPTKRAMWSLPHRLRSTSTRFESSEYNPKRARTPNSPRPSIGWWAVLDSNQ